MVNQSPVLLNHSNKREWLALALLGTNGFEIVSIITDKTSAGTENDKVIQTKYIFVRKRHMFVEIQDSPVSDRFR